MRTAAALLALLATLLSGCGTINATVPDARGRDVMLLGHDPVAYFTDGKPMRGFPDITATTAGKTYYFLNAKNRDVFMQNPARYEPQYGGFCSNGAAYGIKLGHDPTEFEIVDGRIFFFGDILGREFWKLNYRFNIAMADKLWPEIRDSGYRVQYADRVWFNKVPWYKFGRELRAEWQARNPGQSLDYDTGGSLVNFFTKYPGWRAREGFGQPALGLPGEDGPPPGGESKGFAGYRTPPVK